MASEAASQTLPLDQAAVYLASRARARTPLGAAEYLLALESRDRQTYDNRLRVDLDCLDLYRDIFPAAYERSTSPPFSTARVHEFYRLVNLLAFPLQFPGNERDLDSYVQNHPQFSFPFIPLASLHPAAWLRPHDAPLPFQFARVAAGDRSWRHLVQRFDLAPAPEPRPPVGAVGWTLFLHACAVEPSPLRALPTVFQLAALSSGCVWLDLPPGQFAALDWTAENMARLLLHREAAAETIADVDRLDEWLRAAPRERIARAVALWNDAAEKEAEAGFEQMDIPDLVAAGHMVPLGTDAGLLLNQPELTELLPANEETDL